MREREACPSDCVSARQSHVFPGSRDDGNILAQGELQLLEGADGSGALDGTGRHSRQPIQQVHRQRFLVQLQPSHRHPDPRARRNDDRERREGLVAPHAMSAPTIAHSARRQLDLDPLDHCQDKPASVG
eukprot:763695-Rhodomonas_salina.4